VIKMVLLNHAELMQLRNSAKEVLIGCQVWRVAAVRVRPEVWEGSGAFCGN
jgi:hypothetical protein